MVASTHRAGAGKVKSRADRAWRDGAAQARRFCGHTHGPVPPRVAALELGGVERKSDRSLTAHVLAADETGLGRATPRGR